MSNDRYVEIAVCLFTAMLVTFGAANKSVSQSLGSSELYRQCGEEWGFPSAIATCLIEKDQEIGQQLTATYDRLRSCLEMRQSQALRASQRAWLAFQEKNCNLRETISVHEGPGIGRASYAICLVEGTLQRLAELRKLETPSCMD